MDVRRILLVVAAVVVAAACATEQAGPEATVDPNVPPVDAVVVKDDGLVAQILTETGEQARAIAPDGETGERAGVALSPDRERVFFVRPLTGGELEVVVIPVLGGATELIAEGFAPAVHPDGNRVAYVSTEDPRRPHEVLVRNIQENTATKWALEEREGADNTASVTHLGWSPDASRVAYRVAFANGGRIFLFDPSTGMSLRDGERVPPSQEGANQGALDYRGQDVGFVEGSGGSFRLVTSLPASMPQVVRELAGPAEAIDFDASGRHVLILRDGTLFRWSEGDPEPVEITTGVAAAAW